MMVTWSISVLKRRRGKNYIEKSVKIRKALKMTQKLNFLHPFEIFAKVVREF